MAVVWLTQHRRTFRGTARWETPLQERSGQRTALITPNNAAFNGYPRDGGAAEASRRYYQPRLRWLCFPGKAPCSPRTSCVRRGSVLTRSPWTGYRGTASRVIVGLQDQAGAGMSRGMLAGRAGLAWLDDAGLVGQDDGLDPVAQAELGEQVSHV